MHNTTDNKNNRLAKLSWGERLGYGVGDGFCYFNL